MNQHRRLHLPIGLSLLAIATTVSRADDAAGIAFFEKKIRPVLVTKCQRCHSREAVKKGELGGELQLDTRKGLRAGGESGPVIVPGKPEASPLLRALKYVDLEMPPDEPLPKAVIADFERWIKMGAPDPREGEPAAVQRGIDYDEGRKHWAYQPLAAGTAPAVEHREWPAGDIDRHVLARLEREGLRPTSDASPVTVLRRLCLDLTGLPPTPQQVRRFEALDPAEAPRAYASLVDELLRSPRFGEHWARHWLDGVRYNPQLETSAFYRNWVVDAFNADMPYHDFVRRQLAGDLIRTDDPQEAAGNVVATQMLAYNGREADFVESSLEVVGQQFLGISLNCAKCHDHKFDAISQEDYYALAGILTSSKVPKSARDGVELPGSKTKLLVLFEQEPKNIGDTYFLFGGERDRRGDKVVRRLPRVFFPNDPLHVGSATTSGRLELANWIGDPKNPLVARVIVNRLWQRLIGRGIVPTANDFGANGDPPTHPRLLDHLAARLVASRGSLKSVIREIALSRTYRLAMTADDTTLERDHTNRWLARAHPRRLQFEQIMDGLLFVAGELELGQPEPVLQINKWPTRKRKDKSYGGLRAIYVRDQGRESAAFDGPSTELLNVERSRSVTAPQLMFLLNGAMVRDLVPKIARRLADAAPDEPATKRETDQIDAAYRLLFARPATSSERELGLEFVQEHGLERYVHALLLTNEFLYPN